MKLTSDKLGDASMEFRNKERWHPRAVRVDGEHVVCYTRAVVPENKY